MATAAHGGQAVGMAVALCRQLGLKPSDFTDPETIKLLQQRLNISGQSIPRVPINEKENLAKEAEISATSELILDQIPFDGDWFDLKIAAGQLLPLCKNTPYRIEISVDSRVDTILEVEMQCSTKLGNYTPDLLIEKQLIPITQGIRNVEIMFKNTVSDDQYGFILFRSNPEIKIRCSEKRTTGIVSVFNKTNPAVNNYGKQVPPEGSGFDSFEFWCPERRPKGQNIAMKISPALPCYRRQNIVNGYTRPYLQPNAWLADLNDPNPTIYLTWNEPKTIHSVTLFFDADFDHPMESSQMGHPEDVIPFCIKNYRIYNGQELIYNCQSNHQSLNHIQFPNPVETSALRIELEHPSLTVPSALFEIFIN
jgi:hypothetical protein